MMNDHIFIAIIAALINLLLSTLVPCALKQTEQPLLSEVNKMFNQHRDMLITSSVLTGVIVFIALQAAPTVKEELPVSLLNLMKLGNTGITSDYKTNL